MFCDNCGAENKDNATYCGKCGSRLPEASTFEEGAGREQRRRAPIATNVIAVIAACIVVAAITGFFILNNRMARDASASRSNGAHSNVLRILDGTEEEKTEYLASKEITIEGIGLTRVYSYEYDKEGRCVKIVVDEDYGDEATGVRGTCHWEERVAYPTESTILYEKTASGMEDERENGTFKKSVEMVLNDRDEPVKVVTSEYDGTRSTRLDEREYYDSGVLRSVESSYSYELAPSSVDDYSLVYSYCEYSENGELVTDIWENEDGTRYEWYYELDEQGNIVTRISHNTFSDGKTSGKTLRYEYDEYGNCTATVFEDGTVRRNELELDEEGRLLLYVEPKVEYADERFGTWTENGLEEEYKYDENGNMTYYHYQPYEADGTLSTRYSFEKYFEYTLV